MKDFKFLYKNIYKKNYIYYFWIWDKKLKINRLLFFFYKIKTIILYKNIYFFPFLKINFLLFIFSYNLNIIKKLFKLTEKILNIWFYLKLNLNGIGYKVFYLKNTLILILNYSHIIKLRFLNLNEMEIILNINNIIILKSTNKYLLGIFSYIIKLFRISNNYNKNGIRNIYEYLKINKVKILKK
ncbi:ribosomal protein l6 (apicoplast) [Cystoisospora suis]|uniref:Ribosomal protein l6 n=1 Tax=Cystoisospora suis TaxID=483139 RepID=A0A2C6LF71_9APIC|nr:ribosomal protein l6 [Cystoisospora suis]